MSEFCDEDSDYRCGGGDGECCGEESYAGHYWGITFHCLVVEGLVVEETPEDEALEEGAGEGDGGGAVLEDGRWDDGVCCEAVFINRKDDEAHDADDQGDQGAPGGPGVENPAPSEWDQEGGQAADEDYGADVVDLPQFLGQGGWDDVELEEEDDGDEADADEGEVDIEYPALFILTIGHRAGR